MGDDYPLFTDKFLVTLRLDIGHRCAGGFLRTARVGNVEQMMSRHRDQTSLCYLPEYKFKADKPSR